MGADLGQICTDRGTIVIYIVMSTKVYSCPICSYKNYKVSNFKRHYEGVNNECRNEAYHLGLHGSVACVMMTQMLFITGMN